MVVAVTAEDTPYCSTGVDIVADRLFGLGASAVSELQDATGGAVRIVADLPVGALAGLEESDLAFELLEVDPAWSDRWRDHATAVAVGRRFVVRPEWVPHDEDLARGRVEVLVDAADAFGSGSHPTTRLCLAAVEQVVAPGDAVLDVGCGTGVLGVAALLLGAGSLVAVDVDPAAIGATLRTASLNGVADRVGEVSQRPVADVTVDHGPFDLVLANLLIPVIETLGRDLAAATRSGGHLVLSGLLDDQVDRAVAAVGAGRDDVDVVRDDDWVAVVVGPELR